MLLTEEWGGGGGRRWASFKLYLRHIVSPVLQVQVPNTCTVIPWVIERKLTGHTSHSFPSDRFPCNVGTALYYITVLNTDREGNTVNHCIMKLLVGTLY